MATSLKLSMVRGDTATWDVVCTDEDGNLVDLTDAVIYFTGKAKVTDSDAAAVFKKAIGDGITVTDAANGGCTVSLANVDTASLTGLTAITLRVDLEVIEADGNIATAALGVLVVAPDVTLATT